MVVFSLLIRAVKSEGYGYRHTDYFTLNHAATPKLLL